MQNGCTGTGTVLTLVGVGAMTGHKRRWWRTREAPTPATYPSGNPESGADLKVGTSQSLPGDVSGHSQGDTRAAQTAVGPSVNFLSAEQRARRCGAQACG
ncbi:hypothetical protein NDU88_004363 [Pleurodeles waltl]|uniref:Uncharacterized protein n=1 Tax=Pleurodeles waltl TaxID=8319 RepID=A0AAV7VG25_PLEWA|nr:hypothetical protein NDU88_004363 [Pleurodeles waltl]